MTARDIFDAACAGAVALAFLLVVLAFFKAAKR